MRAFYHLSYLAAKNAPEYLPELCLCKIGAIGSTFATPRGAMAWEQPKNNIERPKPVRVGFQIKNKLNNLQACGISCSQMALEFIEIWWCWLWCHLRYIRGDLWYLPKICSSHFATKYIFAHSLMLMVWLGHTFSWTSSWVSDYIVCWLSIVISSFLSCVA